MPGNRSEPRRFPRLKRPAVFIASSSDVQPVRERVHSSLQAMLGRIVPLEGIKVFSWDVDLNVFDQRLSMQENIARAADEQCRAAICILGERTGYPLSDGFDASVIGRIDYWTDTRRRFRLVHPWPRNMAEQLETVAAGGFPLSGTVFEFLDAFGAGTPCHLCYLAENTIRADDDKVALNGWKWRNSHAHLAEGELARFLGTEYAIQTGGVRNLVCALAERGREAVRYAGTDEAVQGISAFLAAQFTTPERHGNPYRFLDFYDLADSADFRGREEETRRALSFFHERIGADRGPPCLRITGESGCGKTSFMRAGVLAGLRQKEMRGRFVTIALRPTDFHGEGGRTEKVLLQLARLIARELQELVITAADLEELARAPAPRQPAILADILGRCLPQRPEGGSRHLIIGLDQFEEIVDELGDARYASPWKPLLSFADAAAGTGMMGFVYTLESSRLASFRELGLQGALAEAEEVDLGGLSGSFIAEIIREPFRSAGYPLSKKVVEALKHNYEIYRSAPETGRQSCLPLLALKLSNLYDQIDADPGIRRLEPGETVGLKSSFGEDAVSDREVQLEPVKDELDFRREIEELARAAWPYGDRSEEEQLRELDYFLRPLVRGGGDDYSQPVLQSVGRSAYTPGNQILESFLQRRLVVKESGRMRLVHEAVIRQWSLAAKWWDKNARFLRSEAKFRDQARLWRSDGQQAEALPRDPQSIDIACEILRAYVRLWPFCEPDELPGEDRSLRDFCLAVFSGSQTPTHANPEENRYPSHHIHLAASYGLVELGRRFIAEQPDCVTAESPDGRLPIHLAAWCQPAFMTLLIEHGADPTVPDRDGWPPIAAAIMQGDLEMFRMLSRYPLAERLNVRLNPTLLHLCAQSGAVAIARLLIDLHQHDPEARDDDDKTPLLYAAWHGQAEAFEFFRGHCPLDHADRHGWTALHLAAQSGCTPIIEALLGADEFAHCVDQPTGVGRDALMVAAEFRQADAAALLVKAIAPTRRGKAASREGWTALHYAIGGQDPEQRPDRAARHAALHTVRALLAHSEVNLREQTEEHRSPFDMARYYPEVRKALLADPRFNVDELLPNGSTALIHAAIAKDRVASEQILAKPDPLLEHVAPDKAYAPTLLIDAGMDDLVLGLLQAGRINPWRNPEYPGGMLKASLMRGSEELATRLLEMMPRPPEDKAQREVLALLRDTIAYRMRPDWIPRLLELGVDPENGSGTDRSTLYFEAARFGDLDAFEQLLSAKVPQVLADAWGRTPPEVAPLHLREEFTRRWPGTASRPPASDLVPAGLFSPAAWRPATEPAAVLRAIGDQPAGLNRDGESMVVEEAGLPFYGQARLIRVHSPSWQEQNLKLHYILADGGESHWLNGDSDPLHQANAAQPVALHDGNVLDYLAFFCFFVYADEGPFLIVDTLDNPYLPQGAIDHSTGGEHGLRSLRELFRPPALHGADAEGAWRCSAMVYYGDAVFLADFRVAQDGAVEMVEDTPLIADLPGRVTLKFAPQQ